MGEPCIQKGPISTLIELAQGNDRARMKWPVSFFARLTTLHGEIGQSGQFAVMEHVAAIDKVRLSAVPHGQVSPDSCVRQ